MIKVGYHFLVKLYYALIWVVSQFNVKAKKWINGQIISKQHLKEFYPKNKVIWFHCASLGEFEQGRPVMESFLKANSKWELVVTFFSPSGFEERKDYELATLITYLPLDSPRRIRSFLDNVNPNIAVFVKYEFWFGYLEELYSRQIPIVYVSSTFRKDQLFFKFRGKWLWNRLSMVTQFFVQDKTSELVLKTNGIPQAQTSGDTRFDRVLETFNRNEDLGIFKAFKGEDKLLIFGSAWSMEWDLAQQICSVLPKDWKVVIAPHEIDENKIKDRIKGMEVPLIRYSEINGEIESSFRVLILDTIGHLSRAYKYSDLAVIGGGFTDGIHNILEPLVFGCPVMFGPAHDKFWEGGESINNHVGLEFVNLKDGFTKVSSWMQMNDEELRQISERSHQFVSSRAGATKKVSAYLANMANS